MTRAESPDDGLAFDFLAPDAPPPGHPAGPLMTGHANGLITLSLAEADDVERERQRTQMGEPYRTLLGSLPPRDRALLLGSLDREFTLDR